MSVYAYSQPSVIQKVTVLKTEGGASRAYLQAATGASTENLNSIICGLAEKSWQVVPASFEGKPALEVRGFGLGSKLTKTLSEQGWVSGQPTYVADEQKDFTFMDKVRKRSLLASGVSFIVGDIGFFTYGMKEDSHLDKAAGVLYGAGTISSLAFGRKDPSDIQIRDLSRKMSDYLKNEGMNMPQDCSLDAIVEDKHKGGLQRADDLFRRYPSELMNLFFAAAGVCVAVAAYKDKARAMPKEVAVGWNMLKKLGQHDGALTHEIEAIKQEYLHLAKTAPHGEVPMDVLGKAKDIAARVLPAPKAQEMLEQSGVKMGKALNREGWLDVGLGSMTLASGLLATAIKEKKRDPDAPKKTGFAGIKESIEQKPLAIAGMGYLVSTLCHAVSTTIAWNSGDPDRRKSVPFRALFVVTNLLAELLLTISSKGHGHGVVSDKSVDNTIVSLAADLIVKQPKKMQPVLIQHVADFLGRPEILALKNNDVTTQLQAQVEGLRQNPWSIAQAEHAREQDSDHAQDLISEEKSNNAAAVHTWQARAALQHKAAVNQQPTATL